MADYVHKAKGGIYKSTKCVRQAGNILTHQAIPAQETTKMQLPEDVIEAVRRLFPDEPELIQALTAGQPGLVLRQLKSIHKDRRRVFKRLNQTNMVFELSPQGNASLLDVQEECFQQVEELTKLILRLNLFSEKRPTRIASRASTAVH